MIAVIVGGGEGKRLKRVFSEPKFLIKINNEKLIDRQIRQINQSKKIKKIFLSINKKNLKNSKVKNIIKKKIYPIVEEKKLGTAGFLSLIRGINFDDVLVVFGDLLVNFDFDRLIKFHKKKKSSCTVVIHPNNHTKDSDMVEVKKDKILRFYRKPHKKLPIIRNRCLSGIFVFNKRILRMIKNNEEIDISKNLIPRILKKKINIFVFENSQLIKDIGTPKRFKKAHKIELLNLNKRPAIFLDRDGVLNKEFKNEKFSNPLNLFPETVASLKLINNSKYLAIVITNQPSVAKNFITEKKLIYLHKKLEFYLSQKNVFLNDIFYCPHHPEKGFKYENKKLKIICKCRKPNNGLIKIAEKKYRINLKKSFFIGNNYVDFLAAIKSGIKPIMINNKIRGVKNFKNLLDACKYIIKN